MVIPEEQAESTQLSSVRSSTHLTEKSNSVPRTAETLKVTEPETALPKKKVPKSEYNMYL
jgi:hypothetical protein